MPTPPPPLRFDTDFDPQTGMPVAVAPGVTRITAPNAGPYTFTGTNSFLLGTGSLVLVDPGPDDQRHKRALESAIDGRPVLAIILTHTHRDHSDLARAMALTTGAPLWFGGPHRLSRPARSGEVNAIGLSSDFELRPDRVLHDSETIEVAGLSLEIIATPGHCANHLAIGLVGTQTLLSGDHVMGWNSTLVSVPDGSMEDYLASLDCLLATPYTRYLPAHGGAIEDGPSHARALKAHRLARNEQICVAIKQGARTIGQITRRVYPALALQLRPAAQMTVKAHLEYLEAMGVLDVKRSLLGRHEVRSKA